MNKNSPEKGGGPTGDRDSTGGTCGLGDKCVTGKGKKKVTAEKMFEDNLVEKAALSTLGKAKAFGREGG